MIATVDLRLRALSVLTPREVRIVAHWLDRLPAWWIGVAEQLSVRDVRRMVDWSLVKLAIAGFVVERAGPARRMIPYDPQRLDRRAAPETSEDE